MIPGSWRSTCARRSCELPIRLRRVVSSQNRGEPAISGRDVESSSTMKWCEAAFSAVAAAGRPSPAAPSRTMGREGARRQELGTLCCSIAVAERSKARRPRRLRAGGVTSWWGGSLLVTGGFKGLGAAPRRRMAMAVPQLACSLQLQLLRNERRPCGQRSGVRMSCPCRTLSPVMPRSRGRPSTHARPTFVEGFTTLPASDVDSREAAPGRSGLPVRPQPRGSSWRKPAHETRYAGIADASASRPDKRIVSANFPSITTTDCKPVFIRNCGSEPTDLLQPWLAGFQGPTTGTPNAVFLPTVHGLPRHRPNDRLGHGRSTQTIDFTTGPLRGRDLSALTAATRSPGTPSHFGPSPLASKSVAATHIAPPPPPRKKHAWRCANSRPVLTQQPPPPRPPSPPPTHPRFPPLTRCPLRTDSQPPPAPRGSRSSVFLPPHPSQATLGPATPPPPRPAHRPSSYTGPSAPPQPPPTHLLMRFHPPPPVPGRWSPLRTLITPPRPQTPPWAPGT